ncbi:hypothetical protein GF382_00495 [Candidatus Falkowbacteria bacterium]|nr:hypothetical protein [Candidatus Falkowbacteria bacterium]
MSKMVVVPHFGQPFEVDTSDEACEKFGFRHGEEIINHDGDMGTIAGVAPANEIDHWPQALWYTLKENGKAIYTHPIRAGDIKRISSAV